MDQGSILPLKFELRLRRHFLTRTIIRRRRRTTADRMMSVTNQSDSYVDALFRLAANVNNERIRLKGISAIETS